VPFVAENVAQPAGTSAPTTGRFPVIDAHTHIWSGDDQTYPRASLQNSPPPAKSASAEDLIGTLDELGIAGAICIQPSLYRYDHGYLNAMLRLHPNRIAGVCLVDPLSASGPQQLRQFVQEHGYRGLRLNAIATSNPDWLDGPSGAPLWQAAIDLGLPVSVLLAPEQLQRLSKAAAHYPTAAIVIDHLGRCTPRTPRDSILDLLRLADQPNVSVKISALSTLAEAPYPYTNLHPLIMDVYRAYGPRRLMWGTDFPHILEDGPYAHSLHAIRDAMPFIDPSDLPAILGGNAARLYRLNFR
jgi:L-fuconolactonase